MTKIILTRHGQTEGGARPRFRGRADLALSEAGMEQARATSKRISATLGWKPSAVYTSPMRRCVVTGRVICEPFGLTVEPVDGLNDIDYGKWEGLTSDEVKAHWPEELQIWYYTPHLSKLPGGETLEEVLARASSAVDDILRRHPKGTIVLVGHSSVNRVILLHALGLPLSRYRCLWQDMCAVSELNFSPRSGFSIKLINDTYHLRLLHRHHRLGRSGRAISDPTR
jgi:broad specificity phosphatase PhoE